MKWWAVFQTLSIVGLIVAVGIIFYAIFIHSGDDVATATARLREGPTLVSVVSKFLFTTPLIFAVYFTTSNFRHVRDARDKYAWKETVAKNFQNYIKLVKDEFKGSIHEQVYEEERFKFSMETVRNIYIQSLSPHQRKRSIILAYIIKYSRRESKKMI
jgi:hypothetical protein